jgi:hypothetical protein
MTEEASSNVLRAKAARVLRLAHTVTDERARASLLDYVQELIDRADQLEQQAAPRAPDLAALPSESGKN